MPEIMKYFYYSKLFFQLPSVWIKKNSNGRNLFYINRLMFLALPILLNKSVDYQI